MKDDNASNLSLWKSVEATLPGYTKKSNYDGRTQTSISGTYFVMRATELWGPIGEGWGYDILEERFDDGGPISYNGAIVCHSRVHTLLVQVWHKDPSGKVIKLPPHFGHTPYIYNTRDHGPKTDFEAPKKSLTDAVKKSLSMLGFSADVYLGLYDDESYVEAAKVKEEITKADDKDAETVRQRQELSDEVAMALKAYPKITNNAALKLTHTENRKRLKRRCEAMQVDFEPVSNRLDGAYRDAMERLNPLYCSACGSQSKNKAGEPCSECGAQKSPDEPGTTSTINQEQ